MFNFKKKRIYLDYASATPARKEVLKSMQPFWSVNFANPSSIHSEGDMAKKRLKETRGNIASLLGYRTEEIFFTSGGTESNNLAILGFFKRIISTGGRLSDFHAITTAIEHSSVLLVFKDLEKKGLNVTYLKPTTTGEIDVREFSENLRDNTIFVSVMLVNNEIGTIQPLIEISKAIRRYLKKTDNLSKKIVLHTDAVQAPLYLDLKSYAGSVDLLSLDASKLYGPKGIGLLVKKNNVDLDPIMFGGSQENGMRPGTVSIPLVEGFNEALCLADIERESETEKLKKLQNYFLSLMGESGLDFRLNGTLEKRIANNINIYIPGIESEYAVLVLDELGFAVASESACLLDSPGGSYVVNSILSDEAVTGSALRFTFGKATTQKDLKDLVSALKSLYKLRLD